LGAGRCRGSGLGLRAVIRARADPARRPDGAAGSQAWRWWDAFCCFWRPTRPCAG
jgi:hypothetical protein